MAKPDTQEEMQKIRFQVIWNRLLSVVEEQAQTLVRTAFSASTREAGDVSAGVFNLRGEMLAQAVTGTPGHINSMARSVPHFLDVFPCATMRPGDVYLTNDPWKGTGHLHDITMVSPTFRDGKVVALFACTSHLVDIGGGGMAPDSRQVYQEGLYLPIMPLAEEGVINDWLLHLIRGNVREPVQVEGDIYALMACNEIGSQRLLKMMDECDLSSLDELGDHIIQQSKQAMVTAINKLPRGTWHYDMRIDGYEAPVDLVAALTIAEAEITVDYAGTSPVSTFGINCPMCYSEAYTAFGVKCIVASSVPNNAGSLSLIKVTAPPGTIVNAQRPAAVVARSMIGHMLPDVVFGCLHQALENRLPAEGTSGLWNMRLGAGQGISASGNESVTPFTAISFHSGGVGARPEQDGLSATPFPSGVRNVPIEITEAITPIVVWKKDYRTDSGGAGKQRGGLGQTLVIGSRENAAMGLFACFERVHFAARGREGGQPGALGRISLESGRILENKGLQLIPAGERLVMEMPGGGGWGMPFDRDPAAVGRDIRAGLVTTQAARTDYGVVASAEGVVDTAATQGLRGNREP